MKNLHQFLRSLRRTSVKQPAQSEHISQKTGVRAGVVIPLRARVPSRPRTNELCVPNEADYDQAERLRDPEYRYEFDLWRLWGF